MTRGEDYKGVESMRLPQISESKNADFEDQDATTLKSPGACMSSWQVKMPPIVTGEMPAILASGSSDVSNRLREATGGRLDKMRLVDLQQQPALHSEVAKLRLNEFFDDHGSFRFRRLGLTFAAKQRLRSNDSFGSSSEVPASRRGRTTATSSAKAFFLATSAIERDLEMCKQRSTELYDSVNPSDRLRMEDVNKRRLEVVFNEIPGCEKYFPPGVVQRDLLPTDVAWDVQLKEIRMAAGMEANFADKAWNTGSKMDWIFPRAEVMVLTQIVGLWVEAYRPGVFISGMDRSTFCRFILDAGLVDQVKVPFFWAVALFDGVAKPIRWCPSEVSGISTSHPVVPCTNTVSSWLLISVLDMLFRSLFGFPRRGAIQVPRDLRRSFLLSLFDIAKYKLPSKVIEESGLKMEDIERAITYGEDLRCHTPRSGRSSPQGAGTDAGDSVPSSRQETVEPMHSVVIGHELLRSDMLQAMLVEPEVLHVVAQHQELFKKLHQCYADDDRGIVGNMSFGAFRQFCIDFHISPALVSCHFLQNAYESSKCLEPAGLRNTNLSEEVKEKGKRILTGGLRTGQFTQIMENMEAQKKSTRVVKHANKQRRVSKELRPHVQGSSERHGSRLNSSERHGSRRSSSKESLMWSSQTSGSPQSLKEKKIRPPSSTSLDPRSSQVKEKKPGSATEAKVEGPAPWAKVATTALLARTRPWKRKEALGVFGVNAFAETLCRIAFTYLSTYGNNSQVVASGYIRVVWLMTYMRCVFQHYSSAALRRKQEPRTGSKSDADDTSLHESLRRALQEIGAELWESPPIPEIALLPPTRMHALLPGNFSSDVVALQKQRRTVDETPKAIRRHSRRHSTKLASIKPLEKEKTDVQFAPPEEEMTPLCVENGVCSICKSCPGSANWGNPQCRGCSIVDRFLFHDHVFKRLLVDERTHYKLKVHAEVPSRNWRRPALTPPPMGTAHALRKAPELS